MLFVAANPSNWYISKANLSSVCSDKTKDFGEGEIDIAFVIICYVNK